jgi:enterochelin esterase-like enzyme
LYPKAPKLVYLIGEWYFSRPGKTTATNGQGLLPWQWEPGDFPLGWPDVGTGAGWPILNMAEDHSTGVWSYTIPLPSGEFNYEFVTGCKLLRGMNSNSLGQTSCTIMSDPSNPPWNKTGSVEPTSQVYVPSDPAFHTVNYSWEAPTSPKGALSDATYPVGAATYMQGANQVAIYTPPGYDPHRSAPYPTLYLNAGYGGNEVDWSTRADAGNILDNLADKGTIGPVVAVMTNFNFNDCGPGDGAAYYQNLVKNVIPYVQSNYDVSSKPMQRAFAGLSCGGGLAAYMLFNHTSEFGYYGVMSPSPYQGMRAAPQPAVLHPAQARAINRVAVLLGGGLQDPIHPYAVQDLATLEKAGDKPFVDFINGGHDWDVWRTLLRDFLTRVAFRPVKG